MDKEPIKLFRLIGGCGMTEGRAVSFNTVSVKGEFRYYEDFSVDFGQRAVHFSRLILKDPELRNFLRQVGCLLFRVFPGYAQEDTHAGADLANRLAFMGYFSFGDSLDENSQLFTPGKYFFPLRALRSSFTDDAKLNFNDIAGF